MDSNDFNKPPAKKCNDTCAVIGFILGLCSAAAWLVPWLGFIVTFSGIIVSSKGTASRRKYLALAGMILSIIFLVVTIYYAMTKYITDMFTKVTFLH